jgi:hypothetical protein
MSIRNLAIALIGISLLPLAVIGYTFGVADPSAEAGGRRNEGDRRLAVLAALTKEYVSKGDNVTAAMRNGRALAPIPFLNEQLERRRGIFRVLSTDGMTAKTFLVTP